MNVINGLCGCSSPEQWIYHWNVILLPDLLIFLNRLACNIDAEFLKDIFINIGEHNGRGPGSRGVSGAALTRSGRCHQ